MLIINHEEKILEFKFDSGRHISEEYFGNYSVCPNPVCTCGCVHLTVASVNSYPHKYCFDVDIRENKVLEPIENKSLYDKKFAKSFADNLSEEDWNKLSSLYIGSKIYFTEHTPIDEINAVFPDDVLLDDGKMVGYVEILPYGKKLYLDYQAQNYYVHDSYCVQLNCDCKDLVIAFVPLEEYKGVQQVINSEGLSTIRLNYIKVGWEYQDKGDQKDDLIRGLVNEFLKKGFIKEVVHRHRQLRILFKNYRKKHFKNTVQKKSSSIKTGRNDPCPCGSGKKYKKCCLSKEKI